MDSKSAQRYKPSVMKLQFNVIRALSEQPGEVTRQLCDQEGTDLARLRETLLRLREANRPQRRFRGRGMVIPLRRPA